MKSTEKVLSETRLVWTGDSERCYKESTELQLVVM